MVLGGEVLGLVASAEVEGRYFLSLVEAVAVLFLVGHGCHKFLHGEADYPFAPPHHFQLEEVLVPKVKLWSVHYHNNQPMRVFVLFHGLHEAVAQSFLVA